MRQETSLQARERLERRESSHEDHFRVLRMRRSQRHAMKVISSSAIVSVIALAQDETRTSSSQPHFCFSAVSSGKFDHLVADSDEVTLSRGISSCGLTSAEPTVLILDVPGEERR